MTAVSDPTDPATDEPSVEDDLAEIEAVAAELEAVEAELARMDQARDADQGESV